MTVRPKAPRHDSDARGAHRDALLDVVEVEDQVEHGQADADRRDQQQEGQVATENRKPMPNIDRMKLSSSTPAYAMVPIIHHLAELVGDLDRKNL